MAASTTTSTSNSTTNTNNKSRGAFHILLRAVIETVYKSALVGTVLSIAVYPYYVSWVKQLTGPRADGGYGLSDAATYSILSSVTHTAIYIFANGLFGLFDYFQLFQEYKLPRNAKMVAESSRLIPKTLIDACISQFIVNPTFVYFTFPYFQRLGMGALLDPLPSATTLMVSYCICHVFNEFFFYWAHRLFHSPSLYAKFHKQHHNYKGTIGIAAEHANPVEALFANLLPTIGGAFVIRNHPIVLMVWLFLRLRETFEAHSGYYFRNSLYFYTGLSHADEALHHDYHHTYFDKGNFGSELMDTLFGSIKPFVEGGGAEGYLKLKENTAKLD